MVVADVLEGKKIYKVEVNENKLDILFDDGRSCVLVFSDGKFYIEQFKDFSDE